MSSSFNKAMLHDRVLSSQHPEVGVGMKQKFVSPCDLSDGPGSTSSHPSHDISLLKSNCVIALSSLAAEGDGKFYAVRCLVAGVWSLQMQAGLQSYDPSIQLVVVNQNGKIGFRSAIAEGRLLCCNRQYHLGFESWQMDCQEAWSLQGSSLSNCTLRNEMYKLTLNIRITVLAKPTDLLGNPRITSALITTSLTGPNATATSKSSSAFSSYVKDKEYPGQNGGKTCSETHWVSLLKQGTNRNSLSSLTHHKERSNPQQVKSFTAELSKTGATAKVFLPSDNLHESKETSLPRFEVFSLCSSMQTASTQNTPVRYESCTEEGKPDSNRVHLRSSAADWKPTTPGRNEDQLSSFSVMTRIFGTDSQSDANLHQRNANCVLKAEISPRNASTSGTPRKVRKWKRNIEGNQKGFSVGPEGDSRPSCGLKRSQEPSFIDFMGEGGTFLSSDGSNKSVSSRDGGSSPHVVIKRQNGFLATKVDFDLSPRLQQRNPTGNAPENGAEMSKYSKECQLEAAVTNLRKESVQQEKEKVIHWKLQAAVRLLKTETEHKLALIAKAAFQEAYARTFQDDMKRKNWASKDVSPVKRTASIKLQRNLTPPSTNIFSYQNKRPWMYPFKRASAAREEEATLAVSHIRRSSSTRLQMLLKLWFFLPVPLLSLAYVTLIYRRKKKSDA